MSSAAAAQRRTIATALEDELVERERTAETAKLNRMVDEVKAEYSSSLPK